MTRADLFKNAIRALNIIPNTELWTDPSHPFKDTYDLVAAMEKSLAETHSATIVFGEMACKALRDEDVTRAEIEEWGSILTVTFPTVEELDAYCTGVEDTEGWLDAVAVTAGDYPQLFLEDVA